MAGCQCRETRVSPPTTAVNWGLTPIPGLKPNRSALESGMAWTTLVLAGLFEVGWAVGLKYTDGFTRLVPTLLTAASMVVSLVLLGLALRTLPLGTAYAVWTGIGTVGTAILGMVLFREPATVMRLACIALIVAGIIGLRVART